MYNTSAINAKIITKFPPKFIRNRNGLVFASDKPLTLHINCRTERTTVVTNYSGFLNVEEGCEITSNEMSISAHSNIKTHTIEIDIAEHDVSLITIPELKNISNTIAQLKEVLNLTLPNEPMDLHAVENRLKLLQVHNNLSRWDTKPSIIGYVALALIIVSSGIFLVFYIRLRYMRGSIQLPMALARAAMPSGRQHHNHEQADRISLNTAEAFLNKLCTTD